jgi:amino acid permease
MKVTSIVFFNKIGFLRIVEAIGEAFFVRQFTRNGGLFIGGFGGILSVFVASSSFQGVAAIGLAAAET